MNETELALVHFVRKIMIARGHNPSGFQPCGDLKWTCLCMSCGQSIILNPEVYASPRVEGDPVMTNCRGGAW